MTKTEAMKTLKFKGYSDDTFGEYGITQDDYDNCATCEPIQCIVDCGEKGRIMVIGQYSHCDSGCWSIGISKVDENDTFPNWNYRFENPGNSYSLELLIDLPCSDFTLTWFDNGEEVKRNDK